MGTRKSEWWASIKPILEREEVKNDAKALAKELSDILEFKVTDADSLEQLTKEFNKQLANMGKQQIVFSEKTLQGIVSQFANAIAEGLTVGFNAGSGQVETKNIGNNLGKSIGDGVAQGIVSGVKDGISAASHDIIAQLNDLQKRKNELHEQSANLDKKLSKYERLSEISTMEYDEFKPLSLDGDIDEQAQRIMGEFIDAEDALNEVTSGTKEYNAALIKALQAAEQLYRMSRTINANKDLVKDKTLLSDFEFTSLSDTTADVFEKADADFNKILRNFYKYYENQIKNIKVELGQIDEQLIVLKQNKVEIIDQEKSKYALKTLKEIEDAQKRIEQKNKRSGGKTISGYLSAIEYEPGSESLQFLRNSYERSSNEDWESQYRWLIKFVKEYENYSKQIESETDNIKQKNMRARQKQYASLYEDLKPMAENAENSLRQVLNMQKIEAPSDIVGGSGSTTEDVTNAEKIAASERLAREEAEKKTKAEKEAAEFAKQKRIEEEKAAKAAEKKRIEEEATAEANRKAAEASEKEKIAKAAPMTNALRNVVDFSGKQSKEYMSLIGADATTDVVGGEDYTVATDVLVEQLIDNVKKSILMSLHNHPDDMLAFTPNDIVSYGKLYKAQGVDIHGIIADGVVQTIDFTDISQEVILQVVQAFSKNLSEVADKSEGLFSFKDGDLKVSDDVQALASESPDAYNKIKDQLQFVINNALSKAFTDNNLQPTIKTFNKENLQQLAEYLLQVGQNAGIAVNEAEKLNTLMSIKDKIVGGKKEETSAHQENTEAIKNETKVQEELNNVKSQTANIDDDSETIAKENGALEDKLELLRDIADQYAANITQKQRDRYEELNQKDMDTGLSDKEDERYYELGEQIDAADSALEEFGQTYDRIILKLENGKKVEILPDDKGLRSLYKFADEYGETYGGVEIEDVIFERVKQEANAHQQNAEAIKSETKAQEELNKANGQVQGTGDVSSADVAAANAEAEKQRIEKERIEAEKIALQQEITNKNEELERVRDELADEAYKHSEARSVLIAHIDEVEEERDKAYQSQVNAELEITEKDKVIKDLREQLTQVQSGESGAKASIGIEELKNALNAITYNVKVVQDTDSADSKVAIDEAELKNVLNSIIYNVKIANDDSDNTANKITLDESALELTLKRVFVNILGPNVEQDNAEPNNTPWALESTLNGVIKETLAQIQTNTAKPESLEVAPAKTDVGNVLATENTLAAIKTAVEAINTKVVKGTKAQTSGGSSKKTGVGKKNAESYAGSQYFPEKLKTQTMYLAKFRAQLMSTGKLTDDIDAQIYQLLDGLKQVKNGPDFSKWNQQFLQLKTSVGITDIFEGAEDKEVTASYKEIIELQKIRNKLELEYEKAEDGSVLKQFYAEQLVQMDSTIAKQQTILDNEEYEAKLAKMRAEQARKLGEFEAKSADKEAKKKAANDKKMAQKQAMVGKAGNAIGRAENVWLGAQDTDEPLPPELNERIDELYDKLVILREKQNEVNQAPMATPEQQKELRNQTVEVNSLTNEVGELLSEYQKLSGDNAKVIGKNTLGPDAKPGAYEQQLKQAVKTATNGKAQIKSFDAATKTLTYTVKTGAHEFTEYTATVRRAGDALVSVRGTTKRTETFFEATVRKMKELTSYFSGMTILSRLGQELKRGIQYVKEIDLALTELKKVTDETEETYDKFLQTAAKTANKVGSTIKDIVSSTADWARLGYSMREAAQLAESTQILMNVSEFTDVSQATDALISSVQAFGYTAETSMEVVDLLNVIGNNYAISTADLAQSLTKSSASLVAAGGDLAEAAALTATANAIIQDADSVGE